MVISFTLTRSKITGIFGLNQSFYAQNILIEGLRVYYSHAEELLLNNFEMLQLKRQQKFHLILLIYKNTSRLFLLIGINCIGKLYCVNNRSHEVYDLLESFSTGKC